MAMAIEPKICVYACYQVDENNNLYPDPMGRIYATDESEAWKAWENHKKTEGLHDMKAAIIYMKEDQCPAYITM